MTLPRSKRLPSSEIKVVFKRGLKQNYPGATLYICPGEENHGCVIVGKKIAKKAVLRNRLKRQISEELCKVFAQQNIGKVILRVRSLDINVNRVHQWF